MKVCKAHKIRKSYPDGYREKSEASFNSQLSTYFPFSYQKLGKSRVFVQTLFIIVFLCLLSTSGFAQIKTPHAIRFKNDSIQTDDKNSDIITTGHKPLTRILFIFDSSQSMLGRWDGRRKIDVARDLMSELMDSLQNIENLEVALRVYGHQRPVPPQDCSDTKLEVAFSPDNYDKIKNTLEGLVARGTTPIARSLLEAADDFPKDNSARNIIILVTDGVEACDGDPCAVSLALQSQGVILKPFIIGLGLDVEFKDVFKCVGTYFDANTSKQLRQTLSTAIHQAMNYTSAQVNLLDENNKATETNVVMTFYDKLSGKARYNYMHTINHLGNPDTVLLDVLTNYTLVVHTIPPVIKDDITIQANTHNIIEVPAPQGYLKVEVHGNNHKDDNIECIVRKNNDCQTLNVQKSNEIGKYIVGNYDLEIHTIPQTQIKNINIKQGNTYKVEIPEPGEINLHFNQSVVGSILHETDDNLNKVYTLSPYKNDYSIRMLPGKYRLIYRYTKDKQTKNTVEQSFYLESKQYLEIKTL